MLYSRNVSIHVDIQRGDEKEARKVFGDLVDHINKIDWVYASVGSVTVRVARPMKQEERVT